MDGNKVHTGAEHSKGLVKVVSHKPEGPFKMNRICFLWQEKCNPIHLMKKAGKHMLEGAMVKPGTKGL